MTNKNTKNALKYFVVDFINQKIRGCEEYFDKAGRGEEAIVNELLYLMEKYPTFTLVKDESLASKASAKNAYKGVSIKFIKDYASIKSNSKELLDTIEEIVNMCKGQDIKNPLPRVRKFAIKEFGWDNHFSMKELHDEIDAFYNKKAQEAAKLNNISNFSENAAA